MSKLFLATSFSGHVNYDTGEVHPEYRKSIEDILDCLRQHGGFTVFCAVEDENWVISDAPPEVGMSKDIAEIDSSDLVLALLPEDLISEGLQFEMGYAAGNGKKVIATTAKEHKLGYSNQGVANAGLVTHIAYEHPLDLTQQIMSLT